MLTQIINFFSSKKTETFAIIVLTTAFLTLKHVIDTDTSVYINGVASIIFWGSAVLKYQLPNGKSLGQMLKINK